MGIGNSVKYTIYTHSYDLQLDSPIARETPQIVRATHFPFYNNSRQWLQLPFALQL
jgi:hypothetical protein